MFSFSAVNLQGSYWSCVFNKRPVQGSKKKEKKEKDEKEQIENEIKPINIMILLMPDYGDRYELVPVKVKPKKQTIEELITEVQEKATIRSLRSQSYHCICNGDATILNSQSIIENYFHNDIGEELYHLVITVPYGKSAKEIAKIAKPILINENVNQWFSTLFQWPWSKDMTTVQTGTHL